MSTRTKISVNIQWLQVAKPRTTDVSSRTMRFTLYRSFELSGYNARFMRHASFMRMINSDIPAIEVYVQRSFIISIINLASRLHAEGCVSKSCNIFVLS